MTTRNNTSNTSNTSNTTTTTVCAICGATENLMTIGSRRMCGSCYSNTPAINSYMYKPNAQFHGKHTRYFGVELEVVPAINNDPGGKLAINMVTKALGSLAYLKRDGSVSDGGFEIVTHPFSLHTMYSDRMFSRLEDAPLRSYSDPTCGLHVHVSRNGLKQDQLFNLLAFFTNADNDDFLRFIGQRDWNRYCSAHTMREINNDFLGWNGRYKAINFCNTATIEFRFFKGNIKAAAVYKAVQFCDAILEFCGTNPSELTYTNFIEYVNNMKVGMYKYNHLRRYINKYMPA